MQRQPIVDVSEQNREVGVKTRRKINRMPTLDAETYMMQYPGYAFFWKEHNNGDVDRWLSFGAELVPESMAQARQIEGYKSHAAGSWVNRQVGFDRGGNVRTDYLKPCTMRLRSRQS